MSKHQRPTHRADSTTPTGRRVVATIAGLSAVSTSMGGAIVAIAPAADAAPAPGQDVLNDWGQTAAEVTNEVDVVVDADPRVITARTRYLRALAAYASHQAGRGDRCERVPQRAHSTRTLTDDARARSTLLSVQQRTYAAASRGRGVAAGHGEDRHVGHRRRTGTALHQGAVRRSARPAARSRRRSVPPTRSRSAGPRSPEPRATASSATARRSARPRRRRTSTPRWPTARPTATPCWRSMSPGGRRCPPRWWAHRPPRRPASPPPSSPPPATGAVTLAWAASSSATGYQVFRNGTLIASPTTPVARRHRADQRHLVQLHDQGGQRHRASASSAAVSGIPVATAPAAPTAWSRAPATTSSRSRGTRSRGCHRLLASTATDRCWPRTAATTYTDTSAVQRDRLQLPRRRVQAELRRVRGVERRRRPPRSRLRWPRRPDSRRRRATRRSRCRGPRSPTPPRTTCSAVASWSRRRRAPRTPTPRSRTVRRTPTRSRRSVRLVAVGRVGRRERHPGRTGCRGTDRAVRPGGRHHRDAHLGRRWPVRRRTASTRVPSSSRPRRRPRTRSPAWPTARSYTFTVTAMERRSSPPPRTRCR